MLGASESNPSNGPRLAGSYHSHHIGNHDAKRQVLAP